MTNNDAIILRELVGKGIDLLYHKMEQFQEVAAGRDTEWTPCVSKKEAKKLVKEYQKKINAGFRALNRWSKSNA